MVDYLKVNAIEVGDPPYVPFKMIANKLDITMIRDVAADPPPEPYPPHYFIANGHMIEVEAQTYADIWYVLVTVDGTHRKITAINGSEYVCNMKRLLLTKDVDEDKYMVETQGVSFEIDEDTWFALRNVLS